MEVATNADVATGSNAEATQPAQATTAPTETRNVLPTAENSSVSEQSKNDFALPDAYKNKGWAKNIKSLDDLFKAHDNAQSLIGKKTIGIPEDWNDEKSREEFLSKVRPKTADDYQIDAKPEVKELCHKYGLSQFQAENMAKELQQLTEKEFSSDGFDEVINNIFGNDKEKAKSTAIYIKQVLGDGANELNGFTNAQLAVVYRIAQRGLNGMPSEGSGNLQGQTASMVRKPEEVLAELKKVDKEPLGWTKKPVLIEELHKSQQIYKRS